MSTAETETHFSPAAPPLEPASISACGHCGYVLAGLPVEGLCPECGKPYNRWTLVAFGVASGSTAHDFNAGTWRLVISLLTSLILVAYIMTQANVGNPIFALFIPIGLIFPMLRLIRRLNVEQPGTVRVRINRNGCAQDDLTAVTPVELLITLSVVAAVIVSVHWQHGIVFVLPLVPVALAVAFIIRRGARRASMSATITDGSNTSYSYRVARWPDAQFISLSEAGAGAWRIRAKLRSEDANRHAIDAVINAVPEQIEALRQFAGQFVPVIPG